MMRFAAITLLLLVALDLGADFVFGETGDLALQMPMSGSPTPELGDPQWDSGQDAPTGTTHECFCCCTHLEQGESAVVSVSLYSTATFVRISLPPPDGHPVHVYHPPQPLI